ncbi:MAG TPA: hypothetical protein VJV05_09520 [Pyrinomonadaceae bacterium]|nr:hypothetical protein [Pyrinomonadaceae bacterium]
MKKFRHIAFMFALVLGLAFSVSAQKGPKGDRPPKERPPTVDPRVKGPKGNPPKEKPGKPGMAFVALPPRDEKLG